MKNMAELACAKINLYLHVVGKRDDGYHLLDSLAVFADIADELSFIPHDGRAAGLDIKLELDGPFARGLKDATESQDNLVIRAARLLYAAAHEAGHDMALCRGGTIRLHKNLPVASGIGGGSADAAAALRLLQAAWGVTLPAAALHALALRLGADVPVCLTQEAARMQGVGEVLSKAPTLPPCGIVLLNCAESVSTPLVFRHKTYDFKAEARLPDGWSALEDMVRDLRAMDNDLQEAACALVPRIRQSLEVLAALPGCRFVRMSGSGATCFGLFDTALAARQAAQKINRPGWWAWGGGLRARSMPPA